MIVVFGGVKGGIGKSTLLSNLAVQLLARGRTVQIVEGDSIKTMTKWVARRAAAGITPRIELNRQTGSTIGPQIEMAAERFDDILVDTRGADSDELRGALLVADLLVSPLEPSQADIETMEEVAEIIKAIRSVNKRLRVLVITNKASTHASATPRASVVDYCADLPGIEVMQTVIGARVAYKNALRMGLAVTEMTGADVNQKANDEIMKITMEIWGTTS